MGLLESIRMLVIRFAATFRRRQLDIDLEEELRAHLQMAIESNVRQGMLPQEARLKALRDFGGIEQTRETYRAQRGLPFIETSHQDLRYALRQLKANPAFTCVAVLSIALGIGANTAIFTLIHALLLRSLPVRNPQELMQVNISILGKTSDSFSYPVIEALAGRKDVFRSLGGFSGNTFTVGPPAAPVRTPGAWVSGGFFAALELQAGAGRLLGPGDDRPGSPLVAVISDGYWQRNYDRDRGAIGTTIQVDGQPVVIVGVTPPGFTGANVAEVADLTMAFQALPQLSPNRAGLLMAGNQFNRILARLSPGMSVAQARARLRVIWPAIAPVSVAPNAPARRREAMLASTLDLVPGGTGWTPLRSQYAQPLYVLMGISCLVLMVACANVANLLLARSTARRREIATRLAIGASRGRVIRQLLAESLLLAVMGALLALVFAHFGSRLLLLSVSGSARSVIPLDVSLDWPVLAFTTAITIVVGLLFGIVPAIRVTSQGPGAVLKGPGTISRGRFAAALVGAQVALSLLLLVGAGLFVRTLRNLEAIDLGFRHEGVLMLDLDGRRLAEASAQPDLRIRALYRESLEAIGHVSGVESVSVSNVTPVSGGIWSQSVRVNNLPVSEDEPAFFAVSPGFFRTLSMRLLAGRDFTARDDESAPAAAIVNQEFVRRFISSGLPLGQRVSAGDSRFWQDMEIVGVVGNATPYSLRAPTRPCVFVPFFQQPEGRMGFGTFEIKAAGSLSTISGAVEQVMRPKSPGLPLTIRSFTDQVESSIRREILMAQLAGFFGVLALALATVGLYGLLSYMVTQRTAEIGVRMALGAQRQQVIRTVLTGAMRLVALGILLGLPAVWWLSRLIETMLYGLKPNDPITIAGGIAALCLAAVLAGLLPALRASRIDPIVALKYE